MSWCTHTLQVLDNCQKEVAVKTKREGRGSNLRLGEPDVGFAKTSLYLDSFCGQKRGSKQLVMEAEPAASAPQQVRSMLGCALRCCTRLTNWTRRLRVEGACTVMEGADCHAASSGLAREYRSEQRQFLSSSEGWVTRVQHLPCLVNNMPAVAFAAVTPVYI
jgi:hypothetical protein